MAFLKFNSFTIYSSRSFRGFNIPLLLLVNKVSAEWGLDAMIQGEDSRNNIQVFIGATSNTGLEQKLLQILGIGMGRNKNPLGRLLFIGSRAVAVSEDSRQLIPLEGSLFQVWVLQLGRDTRNYTNLGVEWNKRTLGQLQLRLQLEWSRYIVRGLIS